MNALTVIPSSPVTLAEWQAHYKSVRLRLDPKPPSDRDILRAVLIIAITQFAVNFSRRQAWNSSGRAAELRRKTMRANADAMSDQERDLLVSRTSVNIKQIQIETAKEFGFSVTDLCSARRSADLVEARHVAMWLCKQMTWNSPPEIGRRFGGRDNSTVRHGIDKMQSRVKSEPSFDARLEGLRARIEAKCNSLVWRAPC